MLQTKFRNQYRSSRSGNPVFVYEVVGSEDELAEYELTQGANLRKDEETEVPLFFSPRFFGNTGKILLTQGGNGRTPRYVPDTSEYEKAASLAKQFGGNFGQEIARAYAEKLVNGNMGSNSVQRTVNQPPVLTPPAGGSGGEQPQID